MTDTAETRPPLKVERVPIDSITPHPDNKRRHTTVGALLTPLPGGGFVADTPGLREVGLWGLAAGDVGRLFPELRPHLASCRFADCAHVHEPGCAVRDAVARGEVSAERYESYIKLRDELATLEGEVW